jgi:hypothetical protein
MPGEPRVETFAGRTDPAGRHRLRIDFLAVDPPRATTVTAEATVMDVNRQAWTATANLLVHPADLYVGLKSDRLFVQRGEPLRVQAIVTDLDGKAVAGRPLALARRAAGVDAPGRRVAGGAGGRAGLRAAVGGARRSSAGSTRRKAAPIASPPP